MSDSKKKVTKLAPSNAPRPYKVRKVFEDGSTQLAAFKSLDAAKKKVDENPEYKVFDGRNGKLLYEVEVPIEEIPQFIAEDKNEESFFSLLEEPETEDYNNLTFETVENNENIEAWTLPPEDEDINELDLDVLDDSDYEEPTIEVQEEVVPDEDLECEEYTYEPTGETLHSVPDSDALVCDCNKVVEKEGFFKKLFSKFKRKDVQDTQKYVESILNKHDTFIRCEVGDHYPVSYVKVYFKNEEGYKSLVKEFYSIMIDRYGIPIVVDNCLSMLDESRSMLVY